MAADYPSQYWKEEIWPFLVFWPHICHCKVQYITFILTHLIIHNTGLFALFKIHNNPCICQSLAAIMHLCNQIDKLPVGLAKKDIILTHLWLKFQQLHFLFVEKSEQSACASASAAFKTLREIQWGRCHLNKSSRHYGAETVQFLSTIDRAITFPLTSTTRFRMTCSTHVFPTRSLGSSCRNSISPT